MIPITLPKTPIAVDFIIITFNMKLVIDEVELRFVLPASVFLTI